jgi:hypothetical protein
LLEELKFVEIIATGAPYMARPTHRKGLGLYCIDWQPDEYDNDDWATRVSDG